MTNQELKEMVRDRVQDEDTLDRIVVLEGDEFADGVIGITDDYRLVYSYDKLVESLKNYYIKDGTVEEYDAEIEAIEWLDYNTMRALPYMEYQGLLSPVIIYEFER